MTHLPLSRTAAALTAALAASLTVAACGGSDKGGKTQTAEVVTTVAGSAANGTQGGQSNNGQETDGRSTSGPSTAGPTAPPRQKAVVLTSGNQKLNAGDLAITLKITKLIDPLVTRVDKAQPGNKLVGVFVKGNRTVSKTYEPPKANATAVVTMADGKSYGVRIIADGDCAAAWFPGSLLGVDRRNRKFDGCIGFEVPKNGTPKSVSIGVFSQGVARQATWKLPKAK